MPRQRPKTWGKDEETIAKRGKRRYTMKYGKNFTKEGAMVLTSGYYVELGTIIKEFDFQVVRSYGNYEKIRIRKMNINRPGLQLVGFYDYFDNERVQLLGKVEWTYLEQLTSEERQRRFEELFAHP
ncbi:MAG: hypothetical protein IJ049_05910, partial [Oscillospiraceae bacterium]|nr:hypothetical protein [Oscillospiraceae bacterium]